MLQESSTVPHIWLLASNAITAILTFVTTLTALWFKRKREPHELRKLDAETRQIHTTTEISPVGITLETLREIQAVIKKAEDRREEWQAKEDQMRTQIVHWRNKAEELDGELIDSRQAGSLMDSRLKLNEIQIKKLKSLLDYHNISYAELDHPTKK